MKFFEKSFWRGEDETGVRDLHQDFNLHEGPWYYNRAWDPVDGRTNVKIRFSFDDPTLLNECPFMAKIGLNQDPAVPGKYIGFAYGQDGDRAELEAWAQKFDFAELIAGLDRDAVSTANSTVTPIKKMKGEQK